MVQAAEDVPPAALGRNQTREAQITIKNHVGELNLVKRDDDWVVQERGGYPANFDRINSLTTKVWNLKVVQQEKVGPSQLARLELEAPENTRKQWGVSAETSGMLSYQTSPRRNSSSTSRN